MSHIVSSAPALPEKGNHTVRGQRLSVADWRSLVSVFRSGRSGLDEQRRQALVQAARQFDAALHWPFDRFAFDGGTAVEVFGQVVYLADHARREVHAGLRDSSGVPQWLPMNVSLLPSLNGTTWLAMLLDAWCLPWRTGEGGSAFASDAQEALFLRTLRRMLDADDRFNAVRRVIGPLLLGGELYALALRARSGWFDSEHASLVWQHQDAFAEVARVHPKLLPVLTLLLRGAAIGGEPPVTAADVLHRMRVALAGRLPGGAWRWLIRHGTRFVEGFGKPRLELSALLAVLSALDECDFPPPPARRFMQGWRSLNGVLERKTTWCVLPVRIRRALLAEASRRAASPSFADWCREAERVMFAVTTPGDTVPDLPKRCGYAWLRRRAIDIEAREQIRHALAGLAWSSPVGEVRFGNRSVLPLLRGIDLYDEAIYMHSCLADYAKPCSEGSALVFSVRDEQGRPVANLLYRRSEQGRWQFAEAKRRFNRLPGEGLLKLADAIAAMLQSSAATNSLFQLDPEAL